MARVVLRLLPVACLVGRILAQQPAGIESDARRAAELVTAGKSNEAIPIYTRLTKASPNDPRLFLDLCIAEFKAAKFQDAAVHAETARKLDPNLAAADLFLGASYLQLGQDATAVEPLIRATTAMPNDRSAGLMLGEALVGSHRYQEALSPLRNAAELLPDTPRVWYGLGQAYEGLAQEAEHKLQSSYPDSAYVWVLIGDSSLERHRLESAFGAYRRALEKEASIPDVYAGLAEIYRESGHPDWAAEEETIARTSKRPVGSPSNEVAILYAECKKYRQLAADAYRRLTQLPPSLESHVHAAKTLDTDGLFREAVGEWRKSLALAPNNSKIRSSLAWSLFRSRDYESLLSLLPAMLKEDSQAVDVNFLYGAALLNLQRPDEAIPYLRKAVSLDRTFAPAQAAFGQALLLQGKPEEAISYLKSAASDDREGNIHFQLFRAYQLTGRGDLAAKAFASYRRFRDSSEEEELSQTGTHITAPSK